ncbi:hypothetical protein MJD09_03330 [bacterium]|nr:hypothetical protein [bacterium]
MSRTPETIVNKKAVEARNFLIVLGLAFLFIGYAFFSNDQAGSGLLTGLVGGGLLFAASKIKTKFRKTAELGTYR